LVVCGAGSLARKRSAGVKRHASGNKMPSVRPMQNRSVNELLPATLRSGIGRLKRTWLRRRLVECWRLRLPRTSSDCEGEWSPVDKCSK
jgi:hypothetical protein